MYLMNITHQGVALDFLNLILPDFTYPLQSKSPFMQTIVAEMLITEKSLYLPFPASVSLHPFMGKVYWIRNLGYNPIYLDEVLHEAQDLSKQILNFQIQGFSGTYSSPPFFFPYLTVLGFKNI